MKAAFSRKRFGQHFLHDPMVLDQIVSVFAPREHDTVVEIGPGQGVLTERLADRVGKLIAVELDRDLVPRLRDRFGVDSNVSIIEQDALTLDLDEIHSPNQLRVVGNLPYNISSPLLFHLLDQSHRIKDMCFLLQKEEVDRL